MCPPSGNRIALIPVFLSLFNQALINIDCFQSAAISRARAYWLRNLSPQMPCHQLNGQGRKQRCSHHLVLGISTWLFMFCLVADLSLALISALNWSVTLGGAGGSSPIINRKGRHHAHSGPVSHGSNRRRKLNPRNLSCLSWVASRGHYPGFFLQVAASSNNLFQVLRIPA